jgi:short-subunit dehydrogenase
MKIAVVTGASSGMGKQFALQLSGYVKVDEIWVIARRTEALESLKAQIPVPVRPISLDLCKEESFAAYAKLLEEEKPDVKLLVNAAGFGKFGDYDAISLEDDLRMIDLNCKSLVAMTRLTLPYMQSGSHVLQLDSLSAFQPVPFIATYGATKSFVLSYSRAVNAELKPRGIRMMTMNPGWVKTEFFNHALETNGEGRVKYYNKLWEAKDVVATGLKDLYKTKKDYSIHGLSVRNQVRLVKLLPHSMVMRTWISQQKKAKNNENLTTK